MARVRGRDVLLELMDAVAKLDATSAAHTEQLESLAAVSMQTSATVTGLSGQVRGLSEQMRGLSEQMRLAWKAIDKLDREMHDLSEGFALAAITARSNQDAVKRVGQLVLQLAEGSSSRFERIEGRLDALERKAG